MTDKKYSLLETEHLLEFLTSIGEKKYRLGQIEQAIFKECVSSIDEMTTLPLELREKLKEKFEVLPLTVVRDLVSKDRTNKVLFATQDERSIESVLMRHDNRTTLCISSMVGCPVKCVFCSTGTMGFGRNLTAAEIVGQVIFFNQKLKQEDLRVRNIVFMGMGEPLLNYDEVLKAIAVLNDQKKVSIGVRHITISTSGIVPKIRQLMTDNVPVNLAVSLHAPNDPLRTKLMPINNAYPIKDLMEALTEYSEKLDKRIFYEYVMLKGLNDKVEHAGELAMLLKGQHAHVNLIPFNPGGSIEDLDCTPRPEILRFQKILQMHGIPTTVRVTLGQDIDAACGQLAAKEKKEQEEGK